MQALAQNCPPNCAAPSLTIDMETTQDGFLDNAIQVLQPAKGHRSGLDAVLLAATVPETATGWLADFGAGAGVAGLVALHRAAALRGVLIERDETMANLATQSLALNDHLASRCEVLQTDLTLSGQERLAAGLTDNRFDYVIANPPYNPSQRFQQSPHALRQTAHAMGDTVLVDWVETARVTLREKGELRFILRPESLQDMLAALSAFGHIRILPIAPHGGENARRIIIAATKGSKAGLNLLPPFILHERRDQTSCFTTAADAIMRGQAGLPL